jgi:hypothetical protein
MTAEVAIMNTMGIAMAADSAVTLGVGKTYNTADKLFALSKYHPVGVMIYSSASIMGIEWETIIKCYRDSLEKRSFDTLEKYAEDFIAYLSNFSFFTEERMQRFLKSICVEIFGFILSVFLNELRKKFDETEGSIKQSEIDAVFDELLEEMKDRLINHDVGVNPGKVDTDFIEDNIEIANEIIKGMFEDYSVSKKQSAALVAILKLELQKCRWLDNWTGIVICGYGERDFFPHIYNCCVVGKIGKSLIYFNVEKDEIDATETNAVIYPFAQTEMVKQFAKGIDVDFADAIKEKVSSAMDGISELLANENKGKTSEVADLISEYMDNMITDVYQKPVIDIVASMQKSELVAMAESMVNLTALRRHVTTDQETVGGPVDVALITKGEGFIWIKHKTNYDPFLNQHLQQNYFRGGQNGEIV